MRTVFRFLCVWGWFIHYALAREGKTFIYQPEYLEEE